MSAGEPGRGEEGGEANPCGLEILNPGPLALIQDLGRSGLAHLGVGRSGAADRGSLRLANRLVGNSDDAAGIEITAGGLAARFHKPTVIALAGAPCPVRIGERQAAMGSAIYVGRDDELRVGSPSSGLRTYLAVRGGIDVVPYLGSRSTDTLSRLGPPPLARGTLLPIGRGPVRRMQGSLPAPVALSPEPVLRVVPGPREDWFVDDALSTLTSSAYTVTHDSNRIGLRLAGPALRRRDARELPPEPTLGGALQVPPSGQPILFLADHPVTIGYPVIAAVLEADLELAAQARPGERLQFRLHDSRWPTRWVEVPAPAPG